MATQVTPITNEWKNVTTELGLVSGTRYTVSSPNTSVIIYLYEDTTEPDATEVGVTVVLTKDVTFLQASENLYVRIDRNVVGANIAFSPQGE